jgi:hypothetical protein
LKGYTQETATAITSTSSTHRHINKTSALHLRFHPPFAARKVVRYDPLVPSPVRVVITISHLRPSHQAEQHQGDQGDQGQDRRPETERSERAPRTATEPL